MIALGSDHGGFALKQKIAEHLTEKNIEFKDLGTHSESSVDYPVYAQKVSEAILAGDCDKGVLVCTTGIGISMAANRNKGIRAAVCTDPYTAKMTRLHNNANVLCLGGQIVGGNLALEIVDVFLQTEFSNEAKHIRRVEMM